MQLDEVIISSKDDLNWIIGKINNCEQFAIEVKFEEREYFYLLLNAINIEITDFEKKYFFFDESRQLHISESQFGIVWISTLGLVAKNRLTANKAVNACINQHIVISLLLEKSMEIIQSDNIYDIDSYSSERLSVLTPTLFHNSLFYIEVFCKAYLSLCEVRPPFTHKLSRLYSKLVETMYQRNHNDSLFHLRIVDRLSPLIKYVNTIPGDFKEQFVKYDDNPDDTTIILFRLELLNDLNNVFDLCHDFIIGTKSHYIKQGLYKRLITKAKNEDQKNKVIDMYLYLITPPNNYY